MTDLDKFLATAIHHSEDSLELLGWESVTSDYHRNEADELYQEFQKLKQGPQPIRLFFGTNGRYQIWERQPGADLWPVHEILNQTTKKRK